MAALAGFTSTPMGSGHATASQWSPTRSRVHRTSGLGEFRDRGHDAEQVLVQIERCDDRGRGLLPGGPRQADPALAISSRRRSATPRRSLRCDAQSGTWRRSMHRQPLLAPSSSMMRVGCVSGITHGSQWRMAVGVIHGRTEMTQGPAAPSVRSRARRSARRQWCSSSMSTAASAGSSSPTVRGSTRGDEDRHARIRPM